MISSHIATQIYNNFAFPPTVEQKNAINSLSDYIVDGGEGDIFILNGYAGTGKTTLIGVLVTTLNVMGIKFSLLAPTGRAAKVMTLYSGFPATTIHKKIYRQRSMGASGGMFSLNFNRSNDTIYIVDEASMLSNYSNETSAFGSGHLIDDLIEYINSGTNNRLIIVGDDAQLPPVGLDFSPALNPLQMEGYGQVHYQTLHEVVRQAEDSKILKNATNIRLEIDKERVLLPKLITSRDVVSISGADLIEEIEQSYCKAGIEDTIIITRSNKRAVEYNRGIRRSILDIEDEIAAGDIVMVVKNNYHIPESDPDCKLDFIANGDIAIIERVIRHHEIYDFRFATVQLRLPDYDDYQMECLVLLDSLYSESPSLTRQQSEHLFSQIELDYADIGEKRKRYREIMHNPYWGALQIKFAYAVTCHKAQGGQWSRVFVDRMLFGDEPLTRDYQRWLYTAVTRATDKLYFVNWQDDFFK